MKRSFFLLVVLISSACFGYDVVLKNGKVRSGEVISENQDSIILEDSSGVRLHINKRNIDPVKTKERNKKSEVIAVPGSDEGHVQQDPEPAEKPKPKARVYKKEDLERMPELTILGDEKTRDDRALRNEIEEDSMREREAEAAWNEAALEMDDRIREASEYYEDSKSFCDQVIPRMEDLQRDGYVVMTPEQYEERRRVACSEAERAAKDLEKAQTEYEEFLEEARKKGIPPGWVDPDRIRN